MLCEKFNIVKVFLENAVGSADIVKFVYTHTLASIIRIYHDARPSECQFRGNISLSYSRFKKFKNEFLNFEGGTDRLSRNVGKELPLHAA